MDDNVRAMAGAALLFDQNCGFCRWSVAAVLRHDPNRRVRTVAIQSPEGAVLAGDLAAARRRSSWHLVLPDGQRYSDEHVVPPLIELLDKPGQANVGRLARLLTHAYRGVSLRRRALSRLISRAALCRADTLIRERALAPAATAGPGAPMAEPLASHPPPRPAPRPEPAAATTHPIDESPRDVGTPATGAAIAGPDSEPERLGGEPAAFLDARRVGVIDGDAAIAPDGDERVAAAHELDWQQRFEESSFGRGILSTLIVVTLVTLVAINLPGSDLRRQLLRPGQPYLNALGVDQNWALFAPDPRRVVIDVSATVSYEDGRSLRWHFPSNGALVGAYRDYRWRKWEENLISPANAVLWKPAALWAAAQLTRPGHVVKSVALVEDFALLSPPGIKPFTGPTQQRLIYTLRL